LFKILANAWKVEDIRKKLLYIMLMLLIFRIGQFISLPGIDAMLISNMSRTNETLFSLITGGGFASVFHLGIGPYITSSIIMQLLTVAIPKLEQLKKDGEEGQKKINQITRIMAVGLATLQASFTVLNYTRYPMGHDASGNIVIQNLFPVGNAHILTYIMATAAMVTGTIFVMWMAELLTEKGIGNGSSFIIFANILSSLPMGVQALTDKFTDGIAGIAIAIMVIVLFAVLVGFVVLVQAGERRIPVQYSKKLVGRGMLGNFIPIKVNIAGVMSIIFAVSLLGFPRQIYQFWQNELLGTIANYLELTHVVGVCLYVVLIFMFTFFYTSFAINPIEMAENLKKNGGFVPGIRPGKPTSEYIQKTVDRLSWIGAIFYSLIAIAPILFTKISGMNMGFGGTTLLIVTGVAIEFIKQLESQLLMRHYKGFLN